MRHLVHAEKESWNLQDQVQHEEILRRVDELFVLVKIDAEEGWVKITIEKKGKEDVFIKVYKRLCCCWNA